MEATRERAGLHDPSGPAPSDSATGERPETSWSASREWASALAVVAWLFVGLFVLLGDSLLPGRSIGSLGLSALLVAWGVVEFLSSGRSHLTGRGLFGFGVALFIGCGGFFTHSTRPELPLLPVLAVSYFSVVLASTMFLRTPRLDRPGRLPSSHLKYSLLAAGVSVPVSLVVVDEIGDPLFFAAAVFAANAIMHAGRRILGLLVGLLGFGVYTAVFWDGFGRLILGAFGLALAAAIAPWMGRRLAKLAILCALVPVMIVAAASRVTLVEELNPGGEAGTGLESAFAPVETGAQILGMIQEGVIDPAWGSTYWASAVSVVPRSIWPDKPKGWGSEVTPFTKPELMDTIHSEAPNGFLEGIWNFGPAGMLISILMIGLVVRWIDVLLVKAHSIRTSSVASVLAVTCGILLATSLPDLVWGGTFTMATRGGFRALFLAVVVLPFALRARRVDVLLARRARRARQRPARAASSRFGWDRDPSARLEPAR